MDGTKEDSDSRPPSSDSGKHNSIKANSFDFLAEVTAEEKHAEEVRAKIEAVRRAEVTENALIKKVGGLDMLLMGAVHEAKAVEVRGRIEVEKAGSHLKKLQEHETTTTTLSIGGVIATADSLHSGNEEHTVIETKFNKIHATEIRDKKKLYANKAGQMVDIKELEPEMRILVVQAMKAEKKNRNRKLRERRKKELMTLMSNTGVDDGKGAQKLLTTYVDEVFGVEKAPTPLAIPSHITEKKAYKDCSFVEQLTRPELRDVPLVSQLVTQKALVPIHDTKDKKFYWNVCSRLRRNDGGMVMARMNKSGVDDGVVHLLCDALRENKYCQHLMLHDNRITDIGTEELCKTLRWHVSIHSLWLGGNPMGDRSAIALARLAHLNHNIKDINLSNHRPPKNWFGDDEDSDHLSVTYLGAEAIAKSLRKKCQLTSLNLADQRIKDKGARSLFSSLPLSIMRTLNLKDNKLTDRCCAVIRDVLVYEKHLNLHKLVLSQNNISCDGASDIAYAMCFNKTLKILDLSKNDIDDRGIGELISCLQFNQVVSLISTIYNKSKDERVDRICEMRAKALQALEDHLDRAQNRENFHDTGFYIDRTGKSNSTSISTGRKTMISPGDIDGGRDGSGGGGRKASASQHKQSSASSSRKNSASPRKASSAGGSKSPSPRRRSSASPGPRDLHGSPGTSRSPSRSGSHVGLNGMHIDSATGTPSGYQRTSMSLSNDQLADFEDAQGVLGFDNFQSPPRTGRSDSEWSVSSDGTESRSSSRLSSPDASSRGRSHARRSPSQQS